ncbi:unnamed protein product [Larinioides sclopetarius]|uniref:Secreted protein n=1 Tax=Larinioides sclopetarius TaxID=280406 RepID=A0AAV1ZWZ2_9ARAC
MYIVLCCMWFALEDHTRGITAQGCLLQSPLLRNCLVAVLLHTTSCCYIASFLVPKSLGRSAKEALMRNKKMLL